MSRRRPTPLQWLWYALGGGLPRSLSEWVLEDTTRRSWAVRHLARALVQLTPLLVVCLVVVPVPFAFRAAAAGPLAGILGFETRPLVSADYANDTRSAIVDAPSTMVTDGTMLKVYAWYDNEMGYACRMVDLANIVIARGT